LINFHQSFVFAFQEKILISNRLIHTSVAFFVVGVFLGMYMGIQQDFRFTHVHAHINLLGWVALGLAGLLYAAHPHLQNSPLAHWHYWLHTVGLVIFMGGFAWGSATGNKPALPVGLGASMVALGTVLFALNVFMRLRVARSVREVAP
jgi:cbb3-type cytochrome oxidase subunit 1